ncbi:MAG: DsbC family protein [Thiotrichales bacterium]|nr:DsbC family protein [Thiotrichales bacterium]
MPTRVFPLFIPVLFLAAPAHAVEDEVRQHIQAGLQEIIPEVRIGSISDTGVPGLYQVTMGADVLYVTGDGRYVLSGELYDIQSRENLTDTTKSLVRKDVLSKIPRSEYIEFAPQQTRHTIYVFTDITCGYCRKLHQDVPELNRNGVAVRYLAYPRGGPSSNGSDQLQAVWCSKDRNQAMTDAKAGKETKAKSCDNPVASHYELGQTLGVRGTPAIFFEDGRTVPGYFPPAELLSVLDR